MAGFKGLADKAKQFINKNPDKARKGIDRASKFADEKTGGKYSEKINKGADRARGYVPDQDKPQEGQQAEGGQQGQQGKQQGQQGQQPPQ